jgi:cysteine desulfurase/selenocysteine lyase
VNFQPPSGSRTWTSPARGVISRAVRAALDAHLDGRMLGSAEKDEYFALVERTRGRFAQLINAHADEVALTKNVSEGLNIVAAGMPWQTGDNVVLCPELEHPNNVYCWLNLRSRGVDVRLVSPRGDRIPIDEMVSRIDARTRVVTAWSFSLVKRKAIPTVFLMPA